MPSSFSGAIVISKKRERLPFELPPPSRPLAMVMPRLRREPGVPDPPLDAAVLVHRRFTLMSWARIEVRELLRGGLGHQGLAMLPDIVQLQALQLSLQLRLLTRAHGHRPHTR